MYTRKKITKTPSKLKPKLFRDIRIGKYKQTRYWGIWLGEELLAVTVYKKGALAIKNILQQKKT